MELYNEQLTAKYLKKFSDIDSKVKKVKYIKHAIAHKSEVNIFFENDKIIKIVPEADCCSISYIVEFPEFPFSKLIGKKIKSVKEIKNKMKIYNAYIDIEPLVFDDDNYDDFNSYHLYEIKFDNDDTFEFGLINLSNGYYDGWLSIFLL